MHYRRWLPTLLPLVLALPPKVEAGWGALPLEADPGRNRVVAVALDTIAGRCAVGDGTAVRVTQRDTTKAAPVFAAGAGEAPERVPRATSSADTLRGGAARQDTVPPRPGRKSGNALGDLLDLGVRFTGRGELGGSWSRFTPCDPTIALNCNPGVFPLLKPEVQFGVQVGGTISDRLHIDVDYDQRREFEGANRINVYYQGRPGEVLQRVEIGDVALELPASRYLTEGVPGGNFGFKATARLGGLDVQTLWAQPQGGISRREFRLGGPKGAESVFQEARVVLDDAEYVKGQFFFVVDPAELSGYPQIDVLELRPESAPPWLRPAAGAEIQVYRDERPSLISPEQRAQLGYFLAEAVAVDGVVRHRGRFRRLVAGEDYRLHPSGLWLILRTPLRGDEALAISYRTESGSMVGTLDADAVMGRTPELLLLRGPAAVHHPGTATWRFEMRQVYRIDAAIEVDPGAVELAITLGEGAGGVSFRQVRGRPQSFLKLFGLDEDLPAERLDEARLFQPGRETVLGSGSIWSRGARFGGIYLVFPTLRPFAEPPAVPSLGLSAAELANALAGDLNPTIYDDPDPVRRRDSGRFRLDFRYRIHNSAVVSTFSLGAFGIQEGSEVLMLGERRLQRGVDYTIDYDLGQVTLTNGPALFAAHPDAELRVVWEQRSIFQYAPRTLLGVSAHYPVGARGGIGLVGIYQAEKGVLTRPQLGAEPNAAFLGGVTGRFDFALGWLDRVLGGAPRGDSVVSRLRLGGEVAVSLPNPNRRGVTYLDDFEAGDEVPLSLDQRLWYLGSRPGTTTGAGGVLPDPLDVATAAPIYWQHELLDEAGRVVGPRLARDIDRQIQLAGAQRTEPVLYLTFGNGEVGGLARRWRSITTVLSTTGRDMSRSEYLEFYAAASPSRELALVIDLGAVAEDAFYFDGEGRTEGVYPDGRRWGLGVLDEEARLANGEIWSTRLDSLGLWNQECLAEPGRRAHRPGDPRANCSRGNGEIDTEDLDGNGILDEVDGPIFRYVVRLGPDSPYLIRDHNATGTEFSLYRIPLRGPGAIALNGAGEASWRFIKHLRITVTGRPGEAHVPDIALARLRIVGSRWTKRELHGIMAGVADDRPGASAGTAEFQVGSVSRLTDGAHYVSPPGVVDAVQDPNSVYGSTGVEYNEKSLRLVYRELAPGDRAEIYFRFPQEPRNLLAYRGLRLWAIAPGGTWGRDASERLVVSVGTDPRNRYLYKTTLHRVPSAATLAPEAWLPEIEVDFDAWFELRARAEQLLLTGEHTGPGPLVLWDADSTYGIILEDRARAPNLAAVRELGFAIYNGGRSHATGEVWIDDLRLGGAVRATGLAGHWEVGVVAGEVASATVSYGTRGAHFQQYESEIPYQTTRELTVHGTAQLDRLLPASLGLDLPLTVTHLRQDYDPVFLQRSDLRADKLAGARATGAAQTRVTLMVRPSYADEAGGAGRLLGGAYLRLGYRSASYRASSSRDDSQGVELGFGYSYRPGRRDFDVVPAPVEALIRALLPEALESSWVVQRLTNARLRWTPTEIMASTQYDDSEDRSYRFDGIVATPTDRDVGALAAPRRGLESTARVQFQPFPSLAAGLTFTSYRDLIPAARVAGEPELREAIGAARMELAGLDLGWERERSVESRVEFRPLLASWLRPGIGYTAQFRGERYGTQWYRSVSDDDTTAHLLHHYQADRYLTRSVAVDPELLGSELGDDGSGMLVEFARALRALRPLEVSWNSGADSRFDRQESAPGLGYQFGEGGSPGRSVAPGLASNANRRNSFRARGGVRLPFRTQLDVAYLTADSDVYERGGGRYMLEERIWPDLVFAFTELPRPGVVGEVIARGSATLGYQRTERYGGPGTGLGARRGEEVQIPVRFGIGLHNGVSGSYNGFVGAARVLDPTGAVEQELAQHSVHLAGQIEGPESWRESLEAPLRIALSFTIQSRRQCRIPAGTGNKECVPYVDLVNRQLALTLDTIISQLNVGLQMSFNDRKSFVGLRSGSSQFQLALYGEFNVEGGKFAGGGR